MEENTKKRFSFLIFILAATLLLLFSHLLSSEPKGSLPASPEESIVGCADEWIYYSLPPGKGAEMGLWRIHTETGEKEHIWEKYGAFFVLEEEIYAQTNWEGVYRMDLDGSNPELIFEGSTNCLNLCYENDWIYFFIWSKHFTEQGGAYFIRYHTQTGQTELLLQDIRTPAFAPVAYTSFIINGDYLYTIGASDGKWGIISYHIKTGEQTICTDLSTKRAAPLVDVEDECQLYITECGDQLVLLYLYAKEHGFTTGMYAAPKGDAITKKTKWRKIQFPDMEKGSFLPPNPPYYAEMQYAIIEGSYCGYIFHDGYVYYLNEDWNLCCRPLFGKSKEVIIYNGTALAADLNGGLSGVKGKYKEYSCTLAFGEHHLYYRYYTTFDEKEAELNRGIINFDCSVSNWMDYIGDLPGKN